MNAFTVLAFPATLAIGLYVHSIVAPAVAHLNAILALAGGR